MVRVIDLLTKVLRLAAAHNPEVQAAPACILWPDKERQWEAVIPRLQNEMPELVVWGDYLPQKRTGPAIWLRCVLAGKIPDILAPGGLIPIIYLPGVSRQDLRAVENCPEHLKPLAELQYRGRSWSQVNGKDFSILAYLISEQGGLGLDVARDNDTRNAMQLALACLLDEDYELLRGKHLDKDYFNTLLTGGDPVRDLLHWLDQGDGFKSGRGENEWRALVEVCKSQLAFNPEKEGLINGAIKLATHQGVWWSVWERFCEAPRRYPHIPELIKKCTMPDITLFSDINTHGGWPQWNDFQEEQLRQQLIELAQLSPQQARDRLVDLEKRHAARRKLVWAELGQAPLADALEHLALLATGTASSLAGGELDDMAAAYMVSGWRTDCALLHALGCISSQDDLEAVQTAVRSVYLSWADESARYLQSLVRKHGYPGFGPVVHNLPKTNDNECILFVDGLRFDTAHLLADYLLEKECLINETAVWAALPTVTATGKPAVTPVRHFISGQEAGLDFEPCVAETGQSLKGGYHLRKLLEDSGWDILGKNDCGDCKRMAWSAFGDLDQEGHDRGWKLAKQLDTIVQEVGERVLQLLNAGWKTVRIVTDHGWLLLPGGLPKVELSPALVNNKWGRIAIIKPGALCEEHLYPWYWNPEQHFTLAAGIACYRAGEEFTHGGLSLQECLNLELTVSGAEREPRQGITEITDIRWKGMRCTVAFEGSQSGLALDIRQYPGDPHSSLVVNVKTFNDSGVASVVVENEDCWGAVAMIVLLDNESQVITQRETIIGGGKG
ncbi:MAG: BREX-1 system phosphatase PglZ type B [Syntrophomonas sp.]|nr:BREX-1 system phosphatase PglZ type B [Syntrophomonas sp.]